MALTITKNGIDRMGAEFLEAGELALFTATGEVSGGGYSRAAVTESSASGSSVTQLNMKVSDSSTANSLILTNANDYYFSDATENWGDIKFIKLYSGTGSSATLYYTGDLDTNTVTVNKYNRLKIPAGNLTITINFSSSGS